jgi:hypothetical protein
MGLLDQPDDLQDKIGHDLLPRARLAAQVFDLVGRGSPGGFAC